MLDIKFVRENPDLVKENIRKKFQDRKLPLVDEVIELDKQSRAAQQEASDLRAERNKISKSIGGKGIIIIATIMTMPIAIIISLFFSKLLNAPKFMLCFIYTLSQLNHSLYLLFYRILYQT